MPAGGGVGEPGDGARHEVEIGEAGEAVHSSVDALGGGGGVPAMRRRRCVPVVFRFTFFRRGAPVVVGERRTRPAEPVDVGRNLAVSRFLTTIEGQRWVMDAGRRTEVKRTEVPGGPVGRTRRVAVELR